MPDSKTTTVTESVRVVPKPPSVATVPNTVVSPPTVTPSPPANVLTAHSGVTPPTANYSVTSRDAGYLQAVVDEAKPPCTIVLQSESDWGLVSQMIAGKDGNYHVRVSPTLEARAVWRKTAPNP